MTGIVKMKDKIRKTMNKETSIIIAYTIVIKDLEINVDVRMGNERIPRKKYI